MNLMEFHDARQFAERVNPFLLDRQIERCIELGILHRLLTRQGRNLRSEELTRPVLWAIDDDDGRVCAVAMQSVVRRFVVTSGPLQAMLLIARKLAEMKWGEGNLIGVASSVGQLAKTYAERVAMQCQRDIQMRLFALREVIDPRTAPGSMRLCDERDRALLRDWTVRFHDDIGDPIPKDQVDSRSEQMAGGLIDDRRGWLWINERGEPCAMAAHVGPAPSGVRINFVFTPRDQRSRGYASNLVAALSREQLRAGATFCSLFTDLSNPTSNSIYQKIGYRPIADFDSWKVVSSTEDAG